MAKDPVCGMDVDEKTAAYKSIQANNVYYFCSATCQNEFNKNPEKYLQGNAAAHHASHYGAVCPTPGCGAPARGNVWYFYIGLIALLLSTLLLTLLFAR